LNPILVTGIIFFSSTMLALYMIINNQHVRKIFTKYWKILIILILLNFVFKFPVNLKFFDGLEYEDSYIYKASARSIYEGNYHFSVINPYFPTSCVFGSINDCNYSAIFVTNYLGYPYLIYLGYSIFGYQVTIANIISLLFSSISIVFLFICALLIIENVVFAGCCSFVFITIPMFNVYSSTSLTEPLSNSYAILGVMIYLMCIYYPNKLESIYTKIIGTLTIIFTLTFGILVKTTNLSIVYCLPIISFLYLFIGKKHRHNRNAIQKLFITLPGVVIILVFSFVSLDVLGIVDINKGDISQAPFALSYFKDLAPVFLKSFLSIRWHLFYFLFFLIGLFVSIKKGYALFPILIFLFYLALYTTHYRSYYYTRGIEVTIDEAFRYTTSMISFYSLTVGLGIYFFITKISKNLNPYGLKKSLRTILVILSIFILGVSYFYSYQNRAYFIEDELKSRIYPVKRTLEFINHKNISVISSEHILFQIYGNKSLDVIDFNSIDILIPTSLVDERIETKEVIYLQTIENDEINGKRYSKQFEFIESKNKELIYEEDHFRIYRIFDPKL